MTERKSPIDQALDVLLYAPLGLAITARENLPSLIEKGRQRVTSQVTMARIMGQFAVAEGERQMRERIEQISEAVGGVVDQAQGPGGAGSSPGHRATATRAGSGAEQAPTNGKVTAPTGAAATGDHLAITGYDTLSASQVVQRLAGLSAAELEAVRAYEEQTRGRRTILSKIGQLQAGPKS